MPIPTRAVRATLLSVALVVSPLSALADCVDGVREPTAAERTFMQRASAALAAAVPGPPANATRQHTPYDFSAPPPATSMCKGTPEGAFGAGASGGYLYTFPKAEVDRLNAERRAVVERIRAIEALPPEKEAERKALEDQARAVYAQAPRRSRSDPPFTPEQQAESDRRNAEGRALEQKSREVTSAHVQSVRPRTEALRAEEKRLETFPQTLAVRIVANLAQLPAAGSTPEADVVVFGAPSPGRSAGLRIVNVVVEARGPQGPARTAVFEAVDRAWLQSLIGKPPPEVPASQAQAGRLAAAPPAAVAPVASTTMVAVPVASTAPAPSPARPSDAPAPVQASPQTAPAAPATSTPSAPPPPVAGTQPPAPPAPSPNCPPRADTSGQAANAGATIGGALLGGGWGRSVGSMIGGAVGAVGSAAGSAPPGCPN